MNSHYAICCVSHRRPQNVKRIFETTGTDDVVFFVNDEKDAEDYSKEGAKLVFIGRSLVGNRNAALEYCSSINAICVQIDDDLKKIAVNDFTGKRTGQTATIIDVITDLLPDFVKSKYFYAGFPPTNNPFFSLKEKEYNKLITAPITFTKPNEVRYDETLKLKEDYDYTLQHIKVNGGCIRYGKYLFDFERYKNKGGAVSYRTPELEKASIQHLMAKWPNCLEINMKRENEILIKKNVESVFSTGQTSLF